MRTLAGAIQFLTFARVSSGPVAPGKAAAWFPLVGAALGAAGAGIYVLAMRVLPSSLAALACVAFWTAAGGVLHEDGLADAGMKGSRMGAVGAIAIVVSVLARWQALEHFAGPGILAVCIAAQAVPRAAIVGLAWVSRPTGTGLGYAFSSTLSTPPAIAALAQGVLAAFLCGARAGAVMILGAFLIAKLVRQYFYKRLGGVNGDCLGATEQFLEIFILAMFACGACSW